jgi:hypothetical protein
MEFLSLDATSQYRVLEALIALESPQTAAKAISAIEKVNKLFKEHAEQLWKSLALRLNIEISEGIHPKKCIEICKRYPLKLVHGIGMAHLIHFPVLNLSLVMMGKELRYKKSNTFPKNFFDLPLIIQPEQLTHPLMRGVDYGERPFVSVLCQDTHGVQSVITIHRSAKGSDEWTMSQGNGLYGKITFTDEDPKFVKFKKLLADGTVTLESPGRRKLLKKSY